MINSGINRTTPKLTIVSPHVPEEFQNFEHDLITACVASDDGVPLILIELPGFLPGATLDEKTEECIDGCDIVYWLSDSRTAFVSENEVELFTEIIEYIEELEERDGLQVSLRILLTKFTTKIHETQSCKLCQKKMIMTLKR